MIVIMIMLTSIARETRNDNDNAHYHDTPGLHNKIPAHKIFARVWVAQEPIFSIGSG